MKTIVFILAVLSLGVFAQDLTEKEAKRVLKPFKMKLMKTLKSSMKDGGGVAAVKACNIKAPEILKTTELPDGFSIGRTSHKLRNPNNAPREWMIAPMNSYLKEGKKGVTIVKLKEGHGYLEPIYIKGMCLQCHGSPSANSTHSTLKHLYPNDEALGYRPKDLRGFFWLEKKTK